MAAETRETQVVIASLLRKKPMVAMLAPSFVIDFEFPAIVGKLKRLGFEYVVEVSWGAHETNRQLLELLKNRPQERFITNPCASITRLINTKLPQLKKYLTSIDTPMSATAKMIRQTYPDYTPVFIGPCFVKKLEAAQDHPDLGIVVLTYKELQRIFELLEIQDNELDKQGSFDVAFAATRLYPISGGLTESAYLKNYLDSGSYKVVSGFKNVEPALREFESNQSIKLLDILFCDGGCIAGQGISANLNLAERRQKVINYQEFL